MISLLRCVRIHPVFWLVIAAGTLTGHLWDTAIAFFIVFVHELGHAAAAQLFHWKINEIELLPFGGVAKFNEREIYPFYQECVVIIAGPLQNLWLPLLSYAMLRFPFWGENQHAIFLAQNSALLLFNLLPVWPLDGGRLVDLMLEIAYPFKQACKRILAFSFGALLLFSGLALWHFPFSINLWIILAFIMLAIYKEWRVLPFRFMRFLIAVSVHRGRPMRLKRLIVSRDAPLPQVFAMYYRNAEHRIHIDGINNSGIDGNELASQYLSGRCAGTTIGDCR
ncbi:site-2 protease family protein [Sporolactobacillus sp. CPB3-1]|uniref:Site-2 protease family protein n=1 Tax=Sporolactobacillus mangiferae TaxID=2940498 RepID=A0ABT0M791_9BACL|nr:site-2 protease family protein [Sporolactobacillus mangiferae]MCL1630508.1 site-2 protease family protein [Sporolactobacillus mangiferae]